MKRFRELVAGVRKSFPDDDFFADFENRSRIEPVRAMHYRSYNDALIFLDDESWIVLREKVIEHFHDERDGQRKQGFFNQLNEVFAYRYLVQRGFTSVRFIKEGRQKRPDISFVNRGTDGYCEVKTVGISDDEINRRSNSRVYDGAVYCKLSKGFKNKLGADIERAWEQIHSLGENGIVFILVRFDDIALDYYQTYRQQLIELCRSRGFENLIIKIGHRGKKRIRIGPRS